MHINQKVSKFYIYIYIYIRINTISYTLVVVNISFFLTLMSFEVQSYVNLNGDKPERRPDTAREKKFY